MPLHLLGKKSWNVYNADNIARVKADEAAAAAREAADEERMQELDTERRLALLRGRTPPPLPEEDATKDAGRRSDKERDTRGHDRKRRKLAGEDDTAMEIRLAASITASKGDRDEPTNIVKLRNTTSDAPLTDHAGNIDLFPVDMKEAIKRERNADAEKEKKKKERALEDQYTMRFSNAAGFKNGLSQPWYATGQKPSQEAEKGQDVVAYEGFENKNVWGNEDPRRKEREIARITSNDPFAVMQRAQTQLKKSKEDKKKWAEERDRELRELRATQEREERRSRHRKRKMRDERDDEEYHSSTDRGRGTDKDRSRHRHRHRSRSRSRSRERRGYRADMRDDKDGDQRRSRHSHHDGKSRHPKSPDRTGRERDSYRKY